MKTQVIDGLLSKGLLSVDISTMDMPADINYDEVIVIGAESADLENEQPPSSQGLKFSDKRYFQMLSEINGMLEEEGFPQTCNSPNPQNEPCFIQNTGSGVGNSLDDDDLSMILKSFHSLGFYEKSAETNLKTVRAMNFFIDRQADKVKSGKELRCSPGLAAKIKRKALDQDMGV